MTKPAPCINHRHSADGRKQPRYWNDPEWSGNNTLPVVGVNYFEAMAYCLWLSDRSDHIFACLQKLNGSMQPGALMAVSIPGATTLTKVAALWLSTTGPALRRFIFIVPMAIHPGASAGWPAMFPNGRPAYSGRILTNQGLIVLIRIYSWSR